MEFRFEIYEDIVVDTSDVLSQVENYKLQDVIEFRDYVNDIIEEKGGEEQGVTSFNNKSDVTFLNSEKVRFLIDNIWDISLEDLQNIKK